MEDGDRSFDRLAAEIDGMIANYTAFATRDVVEKEIAVQELILGSEQSPEKRARIALQLSRLLGPCGEYKRVVQLLEPFAATQDAIRCELLLELGHALCRVHRAQSHSAEYRRGQSHLEEVVQQCSTDDFTAVPNLRKRRSLRARACSRLAWSWEATVPGTEGKALQFYRQAVETEPDNPYHLANQFGFELFCQRDTAAMNAMRTTIRQAVATCREHAVAGTELPYAHFTAGRLCLLLGEPLRALGWYARGLRHLFDRRSCVGEGILEDELRWIQRLHFGAENPPDAHAWIERLIALARSFAQRAAGSQPAVSGDRIEQDTNSAKRILIIAGGAASLSVEMAERIRPMLLNALAKFSGTVISGGTISGIPGCVGEVTAQLKAENRKNFELVGYIPRRLPADAPKDSRYDRIVTVETDRDFSPGQILRMWEDMLAAGVSPRHVSLLGFGGGPLTGAEFHVAFAFGASVAAVQGSGGASQEILADPVWTSSPAVMSVPFDAASIQAFATSLTHTHAPVRLLEMAQAFHAQYLRDSAGRLPENMRSWDKLNATYQRANLEQARYAIEILRAANFDVRESSHPAVFDDFTREDIERMAELEHGRWNVDRLRDGWKPGRPRDNQNKIHDCLLPWAALPEPIKEYDRSSIRALPKILAAAGLEIFRR